MAETVTRPSGMGRRGLNISPVDAFLWLVRIAALVVVVWGSYQSLTSGRLAARQWRDLVVVGVAQGSVYALIALGYTMVYGVLRFINFAHGEVFMIGGMTGFFVDGRAVQDGAVDGTANGWRCSSRCSVA